MTKREKEIYSLRYFISTPMKPLFSKKTSFSVFFLLLGFTILLSIFLKPTYAVSNVSKKETQSTSNQIETWATLQANIRFLVLWDWGRKWLKHQVKVAKSMSNYSADHPIDFVITTGDNFYETWVSSTQDKHWKKSFTDVYSQLNFRWLPAWYPVLWNHDHLWNIDAEIAYSQINPTWKMEAVHYTKTVEFWKNKKKALFVFIDTTPFDGGKKKSIDAEKSWLTEALANSDADWKIVIWHHPPFTTGLRKWKLKHIQKILEPIFKKYNVDISLSWHEHDLQYQKPEWKTHYFVSGAGSEIRSIHSPNPETVFAQSAYWFFAFTLKEDKIHVQCIWEDMKILYETILKK